MPANPNDEELHLIKKSSSDTDSDHEDAYDYDSALEKTGYGKFHYLFLMVCGLANASDAVEVLCISFLLPSAECELKLTTSDKGWLSAIMFIGMLVGGYIWGGLGDSLGRKKTLIGAMFINALCGFLSSFAGSKGLFFTFRFFSGVGVGGSIPITWSYFAEFQPKSRRGSMLSVIASFWMIGNIAVAGLAWIVIPQRISGSVPGSNISWRIFTGLCGVPALLAGIFLFFFPESPKFLLAKNQERKALQILKNVYNMNNRKIYLRRPYPVLRLVSETSSLSPRPHRSFTASVKEVLSNTVQLFTSRPVRPNTLKMLYINFAIAFGYYGLWLWFPELFNKLDKYYKYHPGVKVSVCEVTSFEPPAGNETSVDPFCKGNIIPANDVFLNSFLISISALPGNLWTIFHMDKFGRKFFLVLSMVLSGLSAFFIYLVTSQLSNLIISCVFGLVSTMGFNAMDCLGAELFPTSLRSTAMAVTLAAGRLGAILANVVFGYFIAVSCAIPILSVAAFLISGGLVGLLLPNTTNTSLD